MIAVITGDIIHSRKLKNQQIWLQPLKALFKPWGQSPQQWDIYRGDSFQLEIDNAADALGKALQIKALIKSTGSEDPQKRISDIDVRMGIGIGTRDYQGEGISESNGSAFVHSGNKFEKLRKEKLTLAIQSPWGPFDEEMNLYLKLASISMDNWTISSGEIVSEVFRHPDQTQSQIGEKLGIEQNSVSDRFRRAHVEEILELEKMFRKKLNQYLS
ncbi:MAG: transcriptional regulator [Owenweeksia sp.]